MDTTALGWFICGRIGIQLHSSMYRGICLFINCRRAENELCVVLINAQSNQKLMKPSPLKVSFFWWRRVRDSNPRYPFEYTHFPGVLLQPLGQLSIYYLLHKDSIILNLSHKTGGAKIRFEYYGLNIFSALRVVMLATSSRLIFFISASLCATFII